jgi:hypothetical protein
MSTKRGLLGILGTGLILLAGTRAPLAAAGGGLWKSYRANPAAPPRFGPFVTIWEDSVDNLEPAVAYNNEHDEYLVVWYTKQGPNTWDIWARRVGSDGTLKSWFNVATGVGKRWEPAVAYSPVRHEYLIVYTYEVGASDYDLYATRVKWDGSWKSAEFVIVAPLGIQWTPAVANNSQDDEYLVVYANVWASGVHDIAGQRVDGDGTLLSWRNIASSATDLRSVPDVAYNAARNEYLIAYSYMQGSILTQNDIYGKIASANLGELSPQEIHICDNNRDQGRPAVAAGPDEYLVAWLDGVFGSGQDDVFARRLSGDGGVPLGPPEGFPIAQFGSASCFWPDVAYGPVYGYVVTWHSWNTTYLEDVYANYVRSGQDQVSGLPFGMNGGMGSSQRNAAVACTPSGEFLVATEDNLDWTTWTPADYEIRGSFALPHRAYLPLVLREHP